MNLTGLEHLRGSSAATTLEEFVIRGSHYVTDECVMSIVKSCARLRMLDARRWNLSENFCEVVSPGEGGPAGSDGESQRVDD